MAERDYAQTRQSKFWVADQTTLGVQVYPAVTDAVIPRGVPTFPGVYSTFVESEEIRATPDIAGYLKRKKPPSQFSFPLYGKSAPAAGTAPTYGLFLKKSFGTETIVGATSVTYSFASAIEELVLSLWVRQDNMMRGFRDCKPNRITFAFSGTDESRITVEGFLGNEVFAGVGTLGAAIADGVVTTMTMLTPTHRRFQVGPTATDVIRVLIESEVIEIEGIATTTFTIDRAEAGSSGAAHADALEVAPWSPGADTDPVDGIYNLTLGSLTIGGIAYRCIEGSVVVDQGLAPRIDEAFQSVLTGYVRENPRRVTGSLRTYGRKEAQELMTNIELETEAAASIVLGSSGTQQLTLAMPKMRLLTMTPVGDRAEYVFDWTFVALASATGNDELTAAYI